VIENVRVRRVRVKQQKSLKVSGIRKETYYYSISYRVSSPSVTRLGRSKMVASGKLVMQAGEDTRSRVSPVGKITNNVTLQRTPPVIRPHLRTQA
jgi:hypothetical protein